MNGLNQAPPIADDVLKATALLYLLDALETERYETCKDLIAQAKSFGASQEDISALLADHVQTLKAAKSGPKTKNRLG